MGLREAILGRGGGVVDVETAAERIGAYLYGNILTLAALIALHPSDLHGPAGVVYVAGTALSTFVAHAAAEEFGERVRRDYQPTLRSMAHHVRDGVPILSSASGPLVMLALVWADVVDERLGLFAAVAFVVVRLGALGVAVARWREGKASWRTTVAGLGLAAGGLLIALLKDVLTH